MNQVDKYLKKIHNESFGSSVGSVAGKVLVGTAKTAYKTGKFAGKVVAKTAYKTSKVAGKGAYQFGKGFIKGVRNKKKAVAVTR